MAVLLLAIVCTSCDPGIAVVIRNDSAVDKHVKVNSPSGTSIPIDQRAVNPDSIRTYLTVRPGAGYVPPLVNVPKSSPDTSFRTYSFTLKPGYTAVIESRWPSAYPTYGQVFIIDNTDTVRLTRRGKHFKKSAPRIFLGGTWSHSIKQ
ncbi:MAG TPA: hypothetical protein VD993_05635 [Chitinophagaceae bacterium]|nr:hypothetical protein [Chitinophagaceae bacterium]